MNIRLVGSQRGTAYIGRSASNPVNINYSDRNPTAYDNNEVVVGDLWINTVENEVYILTSLEGTSSSKGSLATWILISPGSSSGAEIVTDNDTPTPIMTFDNPTSDSTTATLVGNVSAIRDNGQEGLSSTFSVGVRFDSGTATLIGVPVINVSEDSGSGSPDVNIITAGDELQILVTGVAAQTWNWRLVYTMEIIN